MTDKKISDLTALTGIDDDLDSLVIVDNSATETKKITVGNATASATQKGFVELATDAETVTGTATDRAVTPASLNSKTATDARIGLIELATDAETITGTDTTRAATPASITAKIDTDTTLAGNLDTRIPSQKAVKAFGESKVSDTPYAASWDEVTTIAPSKNAVYDKINSFVTIKAWINFNGIGVIAINGSFNVSSIVDLGTGYYQIIWDIDFANFYYAVVSNTTPGKIVGILDIATEYITIYISDTANAACDCEWIFLISVGDQ